MLMKGGGPLSSRLLEGIMMATFAVMAVTAGGMSAFAAEVTASAGWKYRVVAQNLSGIDNLAVAADGALYATQELAGGAGKVIRWHRGKTKVLISGLDRPDGLLLRDKFLYVTEEVADGRVLEFDLQTRKQRVLAVLNHPEGIDVLPDGDLVVSEDSISGRLLRVRRDGSGAAEVLLSGLNRPEGLVAKPDGMVIFAETATGRVLSYKDGEVNVVVDDLDEPDQVELAPDGSLWITEDVREARLLRLQDGALETVLSGLRSPQGLAFSADGTVWLAERGRRRILEIHGNADQ